MGWTTDRIGATGADNPDFVRPFGSATDGPYAVAITPASSAPVPGWRHTSLRAALLEPEAELTQPLGPEEAVVVPLAGTLEVSVQDAGGERHTARIGGRASVFQGPSDVVYAGRGSIVTVRNVGAGPARVALAGATAEREAQAKPFRHMRVDDYGVEIRGAGTATREVRNFGLPDALDADSILICEVITPAGNWSSWPPHKHDEERPGEESALEEIYYCEVEAIDATCGDPMAYLRVYGTAERPIDVVAEVRSGDVVLVPHGWHGPAIAATDAHLYYLNVMAGPGAERVWRVCFDPAHDAVRAGWEAQEPDPRVPLRRGAR